jgi:putative FmdB family regulatory protein
MPTYTYRCADCGHQFDQFQKFSDDPLTDCPSCAGKVRRVIQPVGLVFKGSGWYVTDSRGSNGGATTDKAEKSDTADKPAAKAEGGDSGSVKPAESSMPAETSKTPEKSEKKVAASA